MTGYSVMAAFFLIMVITSSINLISALVQLYYQPSSFCYAAVEYGIERMNREVSYWMKDLGMDDHPPFIATRGYDSVVWSRLYSRDTSDLEDYQINQVCDRTVYLFGRVVQFLWCGGWTWWYYSSSNVEALGFILDVASFTFSDHVFYLYLNDKSPSILHTQLTDCLLISLYL